MVQDNSPKPTFWQIIKSVLGAMLGVQSAQTRDRDFSHGNPWVYVVVGLIAVALFVIGIYAAVWFVVKHAGM